VIKRKIDDAILAHQSWVVQFQNRLNGIERELLDPDMIGDDTTCAFGQWLKANPEAFPKAALLDYVKAMHGAFHEVAAEVASMIQQYQSRETIAKEMLELQNLSKQLVAALQEMKKQTNPADRKDIPL